ncbi:AIPR family protein, partial [Escherichia sp. HC-CC]
MAVDSSSEYLIENIIRYNNSQNKVEAADFRSTDKTQKRLKEEFNLIPDAEYEGGRRGSSSDVIRRRPNLLGSYCLSIYQPSCYRQLLDHREMQPELAPLYKN